MERKKRKKSAANKIGIAKVEVNGEEVGQATQALSASSVTCMVIM